MSQYAQDEDKRSLGLMAHSDARSLIRLVQCPICSKPYRSPVTLPCGNTLCKQCLPEPHQRDHISYPDLPGRRQAILCPFSDCERDHPTGDCSVDVTFSKIMESIADIVFRQAQLVQGTTTIMEESVRWDELISSQPVSEKERTKILPGGRLLATYALAANGELYRAANVTYPDPSNETLRVLDIAVLHEILEATQKETDCQVCYNLMLDPVTTFCGHTLCRKCLSRVLDHSLYCPVCRRALVVSPSLSNQPSNKSMNALLATLWPTSVAARIQAVALEDSVGEGELNVPLFVVTLAFPHMPTFLRIFEPRYRLMLRRCLEGNQEFGMVMYNRYNVPQGDLGNIHFFQYGTMLRILHAQMLPDGTSLVETMGIYRFRVKRQAIHDGYAVANVERVEDVPLDVEERMEAAETSLPAPGDNDAAAQLNQMSTQALLEIGHNFIERMRARSAIWLQQRVLDTHGQPPSDASIFPYWFASVLPIRDEEKYKLLSTTTVRERLKITTGWIRRIESQRWYQSNACTIL